MRAPVLGALTWELDSVGADLTPAQLAYLAAALAGENQQLDYRAIGIIVAGGVLDAFIEPVRRLVRLLKVCSLI
jgi:hypothetical protein